MFLFHLLPSTPLGLSGPSAPYAPTCFSHIVCLNRCCIYLRTATSGIYIHKYVGLFFFFAAVLFLQVNPLNLFSKPLANDSGPSKCESIQFDIIALENSTYSPVPPFYMLSFEPGGISRSDFLGSDPQNLTWMVRHPQGMCLPRNSCSDLF